MVIEENVPLSKYSTMRLGGKADYLCSVSSETELTEALQFAKDKNLKIHVVGGGSNTIFTDDGFRGLIIVNDIRGIDEKEIEDWIELTIGAGENWDDVVKKSVELGFGDIAALSLIPGSAGAGPVQNIGAYGQQISDCLVSVDAFQLGTIKQVTILRSNCNFSYRTSRFNQTDKGKFIITYLKLRLSRKTIEAPFYKDVEHFLKRKNLSTQSVSPRELREAVIAIRQAKLPDPSQAANTGSFFKNPVVDENSYTKLLAHYPQLESHKTDDGRMKLYAGQLIELAGMKNYHDESTGMATWHNQALVLVNEHAKTTQDLLNFKQKVITAVHAAFGITLEQEPELVRPGVK